MRNVAWGAPRRTAHRPLSAERHTTGVCRTITKLLPELPDYLHAWCGGEASQADLDRLQAGYARQYNAYCEQALAQCAPADRAACAAELARYAPQPLTLPRPRLDQVARSVVILGPKQACLGYADLRVRFRVETPARIGLAHIANLDELAQVRPFWYPGEPQALHLLVDAEAGHVDRLLRRINLYRAYVPGHWAVCTANESRASYLAQEGLHIVWRPAGA